MKEHISWFGLDSDDDTSEEVEKLGGDIKEVEKEEKVVTEKIKRTPINKQAKKPGKKKIVVTPEQEKKIGNWTPSKSHGGAHGFWKGPITDFFVFLLWGGYC